MNTSQHNTTLPASDMDGLTLHIVEDDPGVRSALRMLALSLGWDARSYDSGVLFLEQEEDVDERHACVILDLNMPVLDGVEVVRRLRARGSRLPILMITGDRRGFSLERALRGGAQEALLKPFGTDAFQHAVHSCLRAPPSTYFPQAGVGNTG